MGENRVVRKEKCPVAGCDGEGDNVAVYSDGGKFCFACQEGDKPWRVQGQYMELAKRRLTEESCRFAEVTVGYYTGAFGPTYKTDEPVKIFNYYNADGTKLIRQKIKCADKKMKFVGPAADVPLYLQWKWQPNEKLFITIVEGEEDAIAVAQAGGYQYPVVSVPTGAGGAYKILKEQLQYLLGFKYVVLGFDNDEAGKKAALECADLFEPGRVRIATWRGKDPNDMLLANQEADIRTCIYSAKAIEPDHIVTISDILPDILVQPSVGTEYPWPDLTDITYGYQPGEIHIVVAANGIGKTEYVKELMFHFLERDMKIGLFSFEQNPDSTARRLVGAKLGQKLHLPGSEWNEDKIKEVAMSFDDKIYLYDKAGSSDVETILRAIRFLARAKDCKLFVIDNLKGLCAGKSFDDVKNMMTRLQTLKNDLGITLILLSHVAKDKYNYQAYVSTSPKAGENYKTQTVEEIEQLIKKPGMEWESGRMPSKENVEGSSAVTDLADYVFALARNTTSDSEQEKRTLRVKCLKARLDGAKTGKIFKLYYTDKGTYEQVGAMAVQPIKGGF